MELKVGGKIDLQSINERKRSKRKKGETHARKMKLIERLYVEQEGMCYYCGCKCFKYVCTDGQCPEDAATIEHLYPKSDVRRTLLSYYEHTVMSCYRCNQNENRADHDRMNAEYNGLEDVNLFHYISWRNKLAYVFSSYWPWKWWRNFKNITR